jgi:hypothetical protein
MEYKVIELNADSVDPTVELRYAAASERAGGSELLRIDVQSVENKKERAKRLSYVTKILKQMKDERLIQFFATKKSFQSSSMEAEFLLNKYPCISAASTSEDEASDFFYIKI